MENASLNISIGFNGLLKLINDDEEFTCGLIKYLKIVAKSMLECPEDINCQPSDCDFIIEHNDKVKKLIPKFDTIRGS